MAPRVLATLEDLYGGSRIDAAAITFCRTLLQCLRAVVRLEETTATLLAQIQICASKWYSSCVSDELRRFLSATGLDRKHQLQSLAQG